MSPAKAFLLLQVPPGPLQVKCGALLPPRWSVWQKAHPPGTHFSPPLRWDGALGAELFSWAAPDGGGTASL